MPPQIPGTTPVQFRCENASLRELRKMAKREERSVADLIRHAVSDYLDRRNGGSK